MTKLKKCCICNQKFQYDDIENTDCCDKCINIYETYHDICADFRVKNTLKNFKIWVTNQIEYAPTMAIKNSRKYATKLYKHYIN